ncbi:hypothetical protein HYALB_00000769 [Hymenoscyphus albidus]|uniref:AB hydrolase-1 domain-containing protein n=1 Tax=Hymenoscyphus albidus TaxID=595503 RepID=A0A9N9LT64_9HELO|nr:hypothetical protein HYALB_00000769 [Hymenoscyphus albidus]
MAPYNNFFLSADGLNIFYRDSADSSSTEKPVILLLHGFPASSHQFRNLIPLLNLPGYGFTEVPATRNYTYTFESIALSIEAFLDALKITKYSVYVFDYGMPTGFSLALRRPDSIQAIITQNGNAYDEGFGAEFWAPIRALWATGSEADKTVIRDAALTFEGYKTQYLLGTPDPSKIAPESWFLDYALTDRPGNKDIQLQLLYDYRTNLPLYPKFQEYFRASNVPVLAVWGKHDIIFIPPGAEAFKSDVKNFELHFLDAGHFAVLSHAEEIAGYILKFLEKNGI